MSLRKLSKQLDGALQDAQKKHERVPGIKRHMPLDEIQDRPHGDTRPLNGDHIVELTESIAAIGLIQPLAVDKAGHLLAGAHRRAALQELREFELERFEELFPNGNIPVRLFDFDASDDHEQALALEVAENEKRRDYTPSEVRELADKLREAGYKDIKGRPGKGQKPLKPALMKIVGKSKRTVERYLAGHDQKSSPQGELSSAERWEKYIKVLERLQAEVADDDAISNAKAIAQAASKLRKLLEKQG